MNENTLSTTTIGNEAKSSTFINLSYTGYIMKPKIEYLITCGKVILEEDTGKASIIDIFQQINITKSTTSAVLPLTIFVRVLGVRGKIDAKISILLPNKDEELQSIEISGESSETAQLRGIFSLVNFDREGIYKIKVSINGKVLDSLESHSIQVIKL